MPLPRFLLLLSVVIALAGATVLIFSQVTPALGISGLAALMAVLLGLRLLLGGKK